VSNDAPIKVIGHGRFEPVFTNEFANAAQQLLASSDVSFSLDKTTLFP
jgi:hypothetical protein